MSIVRLRKITYSVSGALVLASIAAILMFGFNLGIDFTGGSLLEVEYIKSRPAIEVLQKSLDGVGLGKISIQPTGEKGLILRFRDVSEQEHQALLSILARGEDVQETLVEQRFDSIGPVVGKELQRKAWIALSLVVFLIILYITWAFRKVSRPIASWKYGICAIIALIHDITIPSGVFAFLGEFKGVEIDTLFVTALLTILGFSVHDTIVVFDRVRENLKKHPREDFEGVVDISVKEVMVRSISTSLAILFVLIALFLFGSQSIQWFSFALILGIIFGTYSSIFLASPLLITWEKFARRRNP